ncbi:MAG TPA: hypothetical protein VNI79_05520 [Sphingomicrobium sp.]|nr:hypothetical protein [Sphingomicrobium sp.]
MTTRPSFDLSALREIGWAKWDPIGVGGPKDGWPADEYDTYILQAAGQLWNGKSEEEVADYLARIETEHMGLDAIAGIHSRALDVAKAMREYVETLRP